MRIVHRRSSIVDRRSSIGHRRLAVVFALCSLLPATLFGQDQLTIELKDFVFMPITGKVDGTGQTDSMLSRVNSLHEEPGGSARRVFINDMNGPLYIVDKATKKFTTYLDFNGRDAKPGMFHRFVYEAGYGTGFAHFQFDPDYARNGRFYTVHIENPEIDVSDLPDSTKFPGFNTAG